VDEVAAIALRGQAAARRAGPEVVLLERLPAAGVVDARLQVVFQFVGKARKSRTGNEAG
jgi:hypothetical protein